MIRFFFVNEMNIWIVKKNFFFSCNFYWLIELGDGSGNWWLLLDGALLVTRFSCFIDGVVSKLRFVLITAVANGFCMSSWLWAISWSAAWIRDNKISPSRTTSSSFSPASWFSFSRRLRLATCNSCDDSSLGRLSINVSISFAHFAINVANNAA